jgi:hypothetical protein
MSLQVPCPKCQTVLKLPVEAIGKRVKCKKCEERFMIAAPITIPSTTPTSPPASPVVLPATDTAGESQMLSVAESLMAVAKPVEKPEVLEPDPPATTKANDDPFAFDAAPATTPQKASPSEAPTASGGGANPFGFDEGDSVVSVRGKSGSKSAPKREAKSIGDALTTDSEGRKPKATESKGLGNKKMLMILGGCFSLVVLGCGGLFGATYFFLIKPAQDELQKVNNSSTKNTPPATTTTTKSTVKDPKSKARADASARIDKALEEIKSKSTPATKPTTNEPPKAPEMAAPRPAFTKLPDAPANAAKIVSPAKLSFEMDFTISIILSAKVSGTRLVMLWRSNEGFQGVGVKDTLEVFDLTSGKSIAKREFNADGRISMNRQWAMLEGDVLVVEEDQAKISIWSVAGNKLIAEGVEAFAGVAGAANKVSQIEFLDANHVAVFDEFLHGQIFDTSTGKVVKGKVEVLAGGRFARPTGGVGYMALQSAIWKLKAKPNEFSKDTKALDLSFPGADAPVAFAVDSRGKAHVGVFQTLSGYVLSVGRNLQTAPTTSTFPKTIGKPQTPYFPLIGTTAAIPLENGLVPRTLLVDLETATAFGCLTDTGAAKHLIDSTGAKLWTIRPSSKTPTRIELIQASGDLDGQATMVEQAKSTGVPVGLIFTEKGIARE